MLASGWRINAAGRNIALGTLPMSHALSPDGRYLAVLNGGFQRPSINVIDLTAEHEVSRISIEDGWRGLSFSASGDKLYAGNRGHPTIAEFRLAAAILPRNGHSSSVPASRAMSDTSPSRLECH
jgi:DNA-binding beta-propeller fold protein YncE